MISNILDAVNKYEMLKGVKTVTVALSGGADSVALCHALYSLKDAFGFELYAAHYNHQIRGEEALRDQKFCEEFCKSLGIKITVGSGDVPRFAKENGISTELAARKMRYGFFSTLKTEVIATAHTASDNLETALFNLTRGAGIEGLCGIPAKRGKYIRPLIFCTRAQIEDYCKVNKLSFVTDSTNLTDDCTRNIIRHKIVPVLKEINPSVENAVLNTALVLTDINKFTEKAANGFLCGKTNGKSLDLLGFLSLDKAVALKVLKIFYKSSTGTLPDSFHLNALYGICENGGKLSLPGEKTATSNKKSLVIEDKTETVRFSVRTLKKKNTFFTENKKVNNLLLKNMFDCDKIVGGLSLRTRMAGDKMRLANKDGTKTFKKLYNEYKIPNNERENLPVIADENGPVWVYKIGVAQRVAVTEKTKYVYAVETAVIKEKGEI